MYPYQTASAFVAAKSNVEIWVSVVSSVTHTHTLTHRSSSRAKFVLAVHAAPTFNAKGISSLAPISGNRLASAPHPVSVRTTTSGVQPGGLDRDALTSYRVLLSLCRTPYTGGNTTHRGTRVRNLLPFRGADYYCFGTRGVQQARRGLRRQSDALRAVLHKCSALALRLFRSVGSKQHVSAHARGRHRVGAMS